MTSIESRRNLQPASTPANRNQAGGAAPASGTAQETQPVEKTGTDGVDTIELSAPGKVLARGEDDTVSVKKVNNTQQDIELYGEAGDDHFVVEESSGNSGKMNVAMIYGSNDTSLKNSSNNTDINLFMGFGQNKLEQDASSDGNNIQFYGVGYDSQAEYEADPLARNGGGLRANLRGNENTYHGYVGDTADVFNIFGDNNRFGGASDDGEMIFNLGRGEDTVNITGSGTQGHIVMRGDNQKDTLTVGAEAEKTELDLETDSSDKIILDGEGWTLDEEGNDLRVYRREADGSVIRVSGEATVTDAHGEALSSEPAYGSQETEEHIVEGADDDGIHPPGDGASAEHSGQARDEVPGAPTQDPNEETSHGDDQNPGAASGEGSASGGDPFGIYAYYDGNGFTTSEDEGDDSEVQGDAGREDFLYNTQNQEVKVEAKGGQDHILLGGRDNTYDINAGRGADRVLITASDSSGDVDTRDGRRDVITIGDVAETHMAFEADYRDEFRLLGDWTAVEDQPGVWENAHGSTVTVSGSSPGGGTNGAQVRMPDVVIGDEASEEANEWKAEFEARLEAIRADQTTPFGPGNPRSSTDGQQEVLPNQFKALWNQMLDSFLRPQHH